MPGVFASSLEGCRSTDEFVAAIRSWPELWKDNQRLLGELAQEPFQSNETAHAARQDSVAGGLSNGVCCEAGS